MPSWDSGQYLKFSDERTRPANDLVARIKHASPTRVVDLGCGPGNSTAVLSARWPNAEILGLDNSPQMIAAAQKAYPNGTWLAADIARWTAEKPVDVLFSNAALQWVPDHAAVIPRLFAQLAPGGAFAAQIPANYDGIAHQLMRELAKSSTWKTFFREPVREWQVQPPAFYYDVLAPRAASVDLWLTDYLHVLDGPEAIVEWYRGTGLRPFLDRLSQPAERASFVEAYTREIARAYPRQPDGKILFPFRRLFFVSYRTV